MMVGWQRRMWVKDFGMSRETAPVNLMDISADFFHGLAGWLQGCAESMSETKLLIM
jgi:hypothetical protein